MEENNINISENTMGWGVCNDIVEWGEIKSENIIEWKESHLDIRRFKRLSMKEQQLKKQQDKQIIVIVRHLAKNHNYIVHGYWFCRQWQCKHKPECRDRQRCESKGVCQHVPQCQNECKCKYKFNDQKCEHETRCRNRNECREKQEYQNKKRWQSENTCQHRWRLLYTRESLEKYLRENPKRPSDFFMQKCDQCDNEVLISSFLLFVPESSNKKPTTEIICHLGWDDYYRVFGNWKCLHCNNRWRSAYTWISLQKFIGRKNLNLDDIYMQNCKKCNNDNCVVSNYTPLELSKDGTHHKRDLCAKCRSKEYCIETDTYYGNQK